MTSPGGWDAVAMTLAAAAGAVLPRPTTRQLLARLTPGPPAGRPRSRHPIVVVGAATVLWAALTLPADVAAVPAVAGMGALTVRTAVRRRRARTMAAQRRAVVAELLDGLVAELRCGAEPRVAIAAAGRDLPGLDGVVRAALRPSGDVLRALVEVASKPGGSTAGGLAAVWSVSQQTGAPMADPVARLLGGHRAEDRLRSEVAAQLAGPNATAYLLAALPLAGVAMGVALGADPAGFLLRTGPGQICLVTGVALVAGGVRWTRSITASVVVDWTGEQP